mmetsp:Transcript_5926/g.11692  ORF Transcript_5926/g.11692 Transcript_5926/m.11692 type:complete len:85 (+) Transcript_5926:154-408(+)
MSTHVASLGRHAIPTCTPCLIGTLRHSFICENLPMGLEKPSMPMSFSYSMYHFYTIMDGEERDQGRRGVRPGEEWTLFCFETVQ